MDLGDISNIYQENLNSFFRDEKVIELIYKEQFGSENYEENKEFYLEKFKNIMDNTLFIPYITLTDLDRILMQIQNSHGDVYLKTNFNKELALSKKLHAEKKSIIQKYSSFMLDDLKQLFPGLTNDEYSRILKECKNINFKQNAEFIENKLLGDKKGLFTKFKKSKADKIIEKYKKLTSEKILMETSSFYKHLADVPNGKYYTDILEEISSGEQSVSACVGKKTEKNIRYIFLPVFKYQNKTDYLKHALHEVMHISKEHLSKKQYKSGFLQRKLPQNPNDSALKQREYDNVLPNLWYSFKLPQIEKSYDIQPKYKLYNNLNRTITVEEAIHHWQTRQVLNKIVNSSLFNLISFPYKNKSKRIYEQANELYDSATGKFVSTFRKDIQKINNGTLSVKRFKRKVGVNNFELFAQTADLCKFDNNMIRPKTLGLANSTFISNNAILPDNSKYNKIGNDFVEQMKKTSDRRSKFLEKTRKIAAMDVLKARDAIIEKLSNNKKNIMDGPTR